MQAEQLAGQGKQYLPIGPYRDWQRPQLPESIPSAIIVPARVPLLNQSIAAREVTYKEVSLQVVHSFAVLPVQDPHELWQVIQSLLVVTLL